MQNPNKTSPPQQVPALPAPKKWYRHKGIITIIFLALVAGTAVWIYFILNQQQTSIPIVVYHKSKQAQQQATSTPAQTGTSNWQTYTNSQYGFTMQYPLLGQQVNVVTAKDGSIEFKYGSDNSEDYLYTLNISVMQNASSSDLEDWFYQNYDMNHILKNSGMFVPTNTSGGQMLKIEAIPPEYLNVAGPIEYVAFLGPSSKAYVLGFGMSQDPAVNIQPYIDQILSTFQFFGQPQSSSPQSSTDSQSQIISEATNWGSYKKSTLTLIDDECPGNTPQFQTLVDKTNTGNIYQLDIGEYQLFYSPNYFGWSVQQFTKNGFCGAGEIYPLFAYSDKLLWESGCGGIGPDDGCSQTQTTVENYFKSLGATPNGGN